MSKKQRRIREEVNDIKHEESIRTDERRVCNNHYNRELQERIIPTWRAFEAVRSTTNMILFATLCVKSTLIEPRESPGVAKLRANLTGYDALLENQLGILRGCCHRSGDKFPQELATSTRELIEAIRRLVEGRDGGESLVEIAHRNIKDFRKNGTIVGAR